jgi:hypothetical protein
LYLSSTSIIYVVNTSAVLPFKLWNSITLVWTPFLGIKYQTSTGTYFRLLWFEVPIITDIYVTVSSSSNIYCMAKGAKTFITTASHFVRPHENFCTCRFLTTEDVQSIDWKEWLCLIVWNANNPSLVMFVLISYCFLGEIRCYFLIAAHIAYSNQFFVSCCAAVHWTDHPVL